MRKVITFLFLDTLCERNTNTIFCHLKIIKLNATDSTNSYLKELSKKETLEDVFIVVAKEQTNGRGQLGASWQSQAGESLTFSMFKRFSSLLVTQQSGIAFAVALAIKDVLETLEIPEISIKWPNDIMSYQKKLAGILIENQLQGKKVSTSVIGVGLNVNEAKFKDLPQATSLFITSGLKHNLDRVMDLVAEALRMRLNKLAEGAFFQLKEEYEARLFRKDKITAFEDDNGQRFNGIVKGVSQAGELLLQTENESVKAYKLKEIKMLY